MHVTHLSVSRRRTQATTLNEEYAAALGAPAPRVEVGETYACSSRECWSVSAASSCIVVHSVLVDLA